MNHIGTGLSLAAKIRYRMALSKKVVRVAGTMRVVITTGLAFVLCVSMGSCSGFFISPSISSIFITPSAATISAGNTVQLTATARYSDGSQKTISGDQVGWTSSATNVATVTSPGGLVMGVSTGTATITASSQGVNSTASVTVTPENVTSVSITTTQGDASGSQSTATISGVPNTLQFYAYANGSGTPANDLTQAVTWTSSNTNVATISTGLSGNGCMTNNVTMSGCATSVAKGTTNIVATIINTTNNTKITSNTIVLTVQ
jgi:hypothetical protein